MKKTISIILAILMVVTMLPMAVLPAGAVSQKQDGFTVYATYGVCKYCGDQHTAESMDIESISVENGKVTFQLSVEFKNRGDCRKTANVKAYSGVNTTAYYFTYTITDDFSCEQSYLINVSYGQNFGEDKPKLLYSISREKGHQVDPWTFNGTKHSGTCELCGKTVNDNCSGGTATCKEKATCSTCGNKYGSLASDNHDWSNLDGICANGCGAECEHAGQTGDACAICGVTLHTCDFTGEWKFDGEYHWKECDCGNVAQKATHPYGPTCTCGYVCPHAKTYTLITRPVQNADGTWGKGELEVHCNDCGSTVSTQELERDHEGYALLEETLAKLEAAISGDKVTASATAMFTGKISGVRGGAYGLVYTQIDTKIAECIETAKGYIEEFEAGFADGTYRKADWTAMTAVLEEVGALIDNDPEKLIPSVKGDYTSAKSYYNACVNNVNYSQANYDSNEELYDYENKLAALIAGINDGTALKADYTAIDEKIAEIDEMIADITLMDVYQAGLDEIKADLEEMKADENTSAADLEELEATLNEYDAAIEAGIADGTAVKVDGIEILLEYQDELRENLIKKYGEENYNNLMNSTTDEVKEKAIAIEEAAEALTGTVAENAEKIAEIKASFKALFDEAELCLAGTHSYTYEEISPAKCGENATEEGTCWFCGEVLTREAEDTALTHSFTKYEVTEEAKCGIEGKEVATCDHGCGETDEKAIAALEHKDDDGDYICDLGCGYEFEKPYCEDCGLAAHEGEFSEFICIILSFFKLLYTFIMEI